MAATDTGALPARPPDSVAAFRARLAAVQARIAEACARVGRDPAEVSILPVTKTLDAATLRLAAAAGCRRFGENRVQEAAAKAEALQDLDLRWSLIGHLQSNKVAAALGFAHEFQALDSLRLAQRLDRLLQRQGRALDVLVQVNSSGESSKYGLAPEQLPGFLRQLGPMHTLRVRGLMTLALWSPDEVAVRACFRRMRELRERLRQALPPGMRMETLSMGMSGDFEWAVEEGATEVRIGQALFGLRATPDRVYWPR